jgi:ADP-heptose:LPS heptosyltransferase
MRIKTMKFIDEIFGPPLCFCFFLFHKCISVISRTKAVDPPAVKKILLLKFFGMGSIIMAGPLMRAVRTKFPNARIIIVTFSENAELCRRISLIDEILTVDTRSPWRFIRTISRAVFYLRRQKCDISIDLEFFAKFSTILQYLCSGKIRVGYYIIQQGILLRMLWRGNLLTHNVYYNPHRHITEVFLALGRAIGADTNDCSPVRIDLSDDDRLRGDALLAERGIHHGEKMIAMNINAGSLCLERRWPIDRFAELTRKILKNHPHAIVLIGDRSDVPYIDQFLEMTGKEPRVINLAGMLTIGTLTVLLSRAMLLVTNDSGPLHIAVSTDTPTVSLFGPEIPGRYGPPGNKHDTLYAGLYCSPCLNAYNQKIASCKGNNVCMKSITVEDVYGKVAAKL